MTSWISWARSAAESAVFSSPSALLTCSCTRRRSSCSSTRLVAEHRADLLDDELVHPQAQVFQLVDVRVTLGVLLQVLPP